MAEDVLFDFLHMEIVNLMYDSSATNDEQVTGVRQQRTELIRTELNDAVHISVSVLICTEDYGRRLLPLCPHLYEKHYIT